MIDKEHILQEIRRLAHGNDGKPPGAARFERETRIARNDWFPHHWLRWGDALVEAGFDANKFQAAYSSDFVVEKFIAFIEELGHIPAKGELLRKSKIDKFFPSEKVFYKNGKNALLNRVVQYCEQHSGHDQALVLCKEQASQTLAIEVDKRVKLKTGFVYLMRSGRHYKIGRTVSIGSRERQLAIKIPVPPKTIHSIETDDPIGVEAYWHNRFADKRGEGEWFDLTPEDISAFKRWKRIV